MARVQRKDLVRVGVTGHQNLKDPSGWSWVRSEFARIIASMPRPLVGTSSLAKGADQEFAEIVLAQGGELMVVVPFKDYETKFEDRSRANFERLLSQAAHVVVLDRVGDDEDGYLAAGKRVVESSDVLLAVWDGLPAAGKGGTADVVLYALDNGSRIIRLDPTTRTTRELTK